MKANKIRELNESEILKKLTDLKEGLFNLRFQHETGQLENPSILSQTKRDIARVKTIIRETKNLE